MSSPPPTPPATAGRTSSPARSFRSRMGTVMRRASTGLAFNRPNTPFRSESRSSLKVDATAALAPSTEETHAAPSPVNESPAREAAAMASDTPAPATGPSPLAAAVVTADTEGGSPAPATTSVLEPEIVVSSEPTETTETPVPMPVPEPAPVQAQQTTSAPEAPKEVPALVSELPPIQAAVSVAPQVSAPQPLEASARAAPAAENRATEQRPAEPVVDFFSWKDDQIAAAQNSQEIIAQVETSSPEPLPPVELPAPRAPALAQPVTEVSAPAPVTQVLVPQAPVPQVSAPQVSAPQVPVPQGSAPPAPVPQVPVSEVSRESAPVKPAPPVTDDAEAFAWRDEPVIAAKRSASSIADELIHPSSEPRQTRYGSVSPRGSHSSLASSYGQVMITAPGRRVSVSVGSNDGDVKRGRSNSVRISLEDPFADPFADPPESNTMPAPKHVQILSPITSVNMPEPETSTEPQQPEEPEYRESTPAPISFPLPPLHEVINTKRPVRDVPSSYTLGDMTRQPTNSDYVPPETDERLPLLQRTPPRAVPFDLPTPQPAPGPSTISFPVAQPANGSPDVTTSSRISAQGWTENVLPNSLSYFSHATLRVTTDANLKHPSTLDAITAYLDRNNFFGERDDIALPPSGWELWLREGGKEKTAKGRKASVGFTKYWVNHTEKTLSLNPPPLSASREDAVGVVTIPGRAIEDDKLDMEYRYWTYLENHPAHSPLPPQAHAEAMDALTWSYTDCLLPSSRPAPPPFTPQECQELMGLLKSFEDNFRGRSVVHTRIVARVHLRVAQWRQCYFRPSKPLPHDDTTKGPHRPPRHVPTGRIISDFLISCLCLGIPYLFLDRSHHQRVDEESGMRSVGPMLMVGACACLVAAVILSASVTFISLPGLDDISRLSGLVSVILSASSMISAVIALFRHKADVERSIVYVGGGEGLMLLSRRSIIMSLPLVFLAWAIAAFMTGVIFYSFRGVHITSQITLRQPFQDSTHWAVVGIMGGLAGMLVVTALLARR